MNTQLHHLYARLIRSDVWGELHNSGTEILTKVQRTLLVDTVILPIWNTNSNFNSRGKKGGAEADSGKGNTV